MFFFLTSFLKIWSGYAANKNRENQITNLAVILRRWVQILSFAKKMELKDENCST